MSNPLADREVPDSAGQPPVRNPDRRTVLRTAGLVALSGGAAAGLAACASGTSPAATTAPSAAPSSAAPTSAAPSSTAPSSAAPSESATSAAPSGPSVAAAAVPVGGGVILEEPNDYVVTQPTKGDYKAFTAICTHQQCRVTELRDDTIFCACHQSQFSIKDGSVVHDPATEPLKEFQVTVSGGKVYVGE